MKKLLINIEKKNIRYDDFLIEESKESIEFNSKKNQKEDNLNYQKVNLSKI